MRSLLTVDIEQISIDERIQLADELWDSILAHPEKLSVTEA
ncbi:MAG: addiction module protein [Cyanobacteria bacterium J06581_3]